MKLGSREGRGHFLLGIMGRGGMDLISLGVYVQSYCTAESWHGGFSFFDFSAWGSGGSRGMFWLKRENVNVKCEMY